MDSKHQVANRRVYRYTTAALLKETICLEKRSELSHTNHTLYHSCRVLSPLYLGPSIQSRYRENREVKKQRERTGNND